MSTTKLTPNEILQQKIKNKKKELEYFDEVTEKSFSLIQLGNINSIELFTKPKSNKRASSNFVIKFEVADFKEYILINCGHNCIDSLNENNISIKDINQVVITSCDEDNIANLKTLIEMRFKFYDLTTEVISPVNELKTYLEPLNYKISSGLKRDLFKYKISNSVQKIFNINKGIIIDDEKITINESIRIDFFKNNYISESYNCLFRFHSMKDDDNNGYSIFVSGHTKSDSFNEFNLESLLNQKNKCICLQIFSNNECSSTSTLTCENDFKGEYSEEYQKKAIKYDIGIDNLLLNKFIDITKFDKDSYYFGKKAKVNINLS